MDTTLALGAAKMGVGEAREREEGDGERGGDLRAGGGRGEAGTGGGGSVGGRVVRSGRGLASYQGPAHLECTNAFGAEWEGPGDEARRGAPWDSLPTISSFFFFATW